METISLIVANAKTAATIAEGKIKAGITQVDYLYGKIAECNQGLAETELKLAITCEEKKKIGEKFLELEGVLKEAKKNIAALKEESDTYLAQRDHFTADCEALKLRARTLTNNIDKAQITLHKAIKEDRFWPRGDAKNIFEEVIKILKKDLENEESDESILPGFS